MMLYEGFSKLKQIMTNYFIYFIDWIVMVLLFIREGLRPSPVIKPHQGGSEIFEGEDSLKLQPKLVKLVGEKKALILQKFHEWVQVNQKKVSHNYDGATWTYSQSYTDWHERHFSWFSQRHLETLIRELEADGFLIATTDASFCFSGRKAYRLNYERILSYTPPKVVPDGSEESSLCGGKKFETPTKKVLTNNRVIKTSLNNPFTQLKTPTTAYARARKRIGTEVASDVVDVVEKQEHDSGEFSGMGEAVREVVQNRDGIDTAVQPEEHPLFAMFAEPDDIADHPSDVPIVNQLVRIGMLQATADAIVEQYGEDRVEMAMGQVQQMNNLKNPAGWIIWALKNNAIECQEAS